MIEDDIDIQGKQITLKIDNKSESFANREIYDSETSIIYLYELIVEEYLTVFTSGFNVNLLVMGNAHSEKSKVIEGSR